MNMITTKDKTEMYYKFGDRDNLLSSATAGRPTPMPGKTRRFTWRPTVIVASPMIVPIGDSAHAGRVQTRYECDLEGLSRRPSRLALDTQGYVQRQHARLSQGVRMIPLFFIASYQFYKTDSYMIIREV